ncbi:hypothetical protein G5C51_42275, partial [Streptomyces sp. A7024]|nr:hypothetical protein [Streptomyces coryli]
MSDAMPAAQGRDEERPNPGSAGRRPLGGGGRAGFSTGWTTPAVQEPDFTDAEPAAAEQASEGASPAATEHAETEQVAPAHEESAYSAAAAEDLEPEVGDLEPETTDAAEDHALTADEPAPPAPVDEEPAP